MEGDGEAETMSSRMVLEWLWTNADGKRDEQFRDEDGGRRDGRECGPERGDGDAVRGSYQIARSLRIEQRMVMRARNDCLPHPPLAPAPGLVEQDGAEERQALPTSRGLSFPPVLSPGELAFLHPRLGFSDSLYFTSASLHRVSQLASFYIS